ncbi:HAD family hydrolase [Flaviflexus equikiangi]|uniref:Uncharacterized protein n=1 Tax=Flaviflexus equikiangi TaxID=2758573 RepID=A0ABS2TCS6_9ACTO|nr:hypothetical protein [Flaviflexus equikiangi]MBM9432458.1 hypothetical protein [Flaviflexus equikiangi]
MQIAPAARDPLRGMLHHELDRLAENHNGDAEARHHIDGCLDLPVGIASNAFFGSVHHTCLTDHGLSDLIGAEVYSGGAGARKPNPSLIHRAADVLGLPAASCV